MGEEGRGASAARKPSKRGAGPARGRLGLVRAAPWLKAPTLLVRFPGLLLAIGSALAILSVAGAASPLFLSSAGNRTLQDAIAAACPWDVALTHRTSAPIAGPALYTQYFGGPRIDALTKVHEAQALVDRVDRRIDHMGPAELEIVGTSTQVTAAAGGSHAYTARLYTRPGALDHIRKLSSAGGPGVWLPDSVAASIKVRAGDTIRLTGSLAGGNRAARARVAGIYRDLATLPRARFWCAQDHLIYPLSAFSNMPPPPPLIVTDQESFISLARKLGERDAQFTWVFPVQARGLTIPAAQTLIGGHQRVGKALGNRTPGTFFGGYAGPLGGPSRTGSQLSFIVDKAVAIQTSLRGSVDAISLAARAVALLVVAAAGIYWIDRRRNEAYLLSARGVGPVGLAAKVFLEALPVAVAAAFAGWAAGVWLAKALGPTSLLDAAAPSAALRQVVWTAGVGLVLLAIVAGYGAHRAAESEPVRGRGALAAAPWEIVVLGLAGASLYEILTRGTRPVEGGTIPRIDVLIVLFPILFVAGGAGLAVRALRRLLPRVRAGGESWPSPFYLASRRLAAAPRIALALVTAAALAIGILSYAGALSTSIAATSAAKALLFTGSDVSVTTAENIEVPPGLAGVATAVTTIDSAYSLPDQTLVGVLGIDRSTFSRAAFWDGSFASSSLSDILRELRPPGEASAPLPILVAGGSIPTGPGETLFFRGGNVEVPIRVVGTARAFPGMGPDKPLVVADRQALAERGAPGLRAIWARSDAPTVERAVESSHAHVVAVASAQEIRRNPSFLPLSWAFGFLQSLGIMAGLIVLGGMLLYLEARQRSRAITYALGHRMGLTAGSHRASVALELGGLLALGSVLGIGLAWTAARIVYRRLDPMPQLPPPPLFRLPMALFGLTILAVAVASWLAAWRVQRTAEHTRVAEVMRVAG